MTLPTLAQPARVRVVQEGRDLRVLADAPLHSRARVTRHRLVLDVFPARVGSVPPGVRAEQVACGHVRLVTCWDGDYRCVRSADGHRLRVRHLAARPVARNNNADGDGRLNGILIQQAAAQLGLDSNDLLNRLAHVAPHTLHNIMERGHGVDPQNPKDLTSLDSHEVAEWISYLRQQGIPLPC